MKIFLPIVCFSLLLAGCVSQNVDQNGRWLGHWERAESQNGAELEVSRISGDTLTFILFATNGASYAQLEGTALLNDNKAIFLADSDGVPAECEVVFEMKGDSAINISEGGSECGDAMYVWYAGVYGKVNIRVLYSTFRLPLRGPSTSLRMTAPFDKK